MGVGLYTLAFGSKRQRVWLNDAEIEGFGVEHVVMSVGSGNCGNISSHTSEVSPHTSIPPTPTNNPSTIINGGLHPSLEGRGSVLLALNVRVGDVAYS